MADELLEKAKDVFEGQIDFEGQRLAELLTTFLLATAGIVAFLAGYITQNLAHTLWVGLAGAALTFIVVVPPWPFYNKNPENWLPPYETTGGIRIQVEGEKP